MDFVKTGRDGLKFECMKFLTPLEGFSIETLLQIILPATNIMGDMETYRKQWRDQLMKLDKTS
jgi:hypothetical protein